MGMGLGVVRNKNLVDCESPQGIVAPPEDP
jgi:hypothetical protein